MLLPSDKSLGYFRSSAARTKRNTNVDKQAPAFPPKPFCMRSVRSPTVKESRRVGIAYARASDTFKPAPLFAGFDELDAVALILELALYPAAVLALGCTCRPRRRGRDRYSKGTITNREGRYDGVRRGVNDRASVVT